MQHRTKELSRSGSMVECLEDGRAKVYALTGVHVRCRTKHDCSDKVYCGGSLFFCRQSLQDEGAVPSLEKVEGKQFKPKEAAAAALA